MPAEYTTRPPSEWGYEDVTAAIAAQRDADLGGEEESGEAAYQANYLYVERGDHWQDGDTWPMTHSDATIRASILATAEPIFCSVDAVEKCVGRQVAGFLGTEPAIAIVPRKPGGKDGKPSDEQVRRAAEMREYLSAWWDRVELWERMRDAGRRASWARRGPVRLRFLPDALREVERDGETVTQLRTDLSFAEALERIHLSAPLPDAALVYTDEDTQERACLLTYEDDEGRGVAEVWYQDGDTAVRRILTDGLEAREERLPGARLPLAEIRGPLLVTDSLRRQQRRRDYFETILTRGVEAFGFRERYTIGAMPAGYWSRTKPADGNYLDTRIDDSGATEYLLPLPRIMGNGVLTEIQPRIVQGDDGKPVIASASVVVVDPADPDFAIKAAAHAQMTILESCDQLHILDGDKAVSGYSKRQSRFNFTQRLNAYKGSAEGAIAAVLEGAIQNALLMTANPGDLATFLDEFRITVALKIDTGPLSAEEEEALMTQSEKLFRARSSVQAALGVEDVEAENRAILSDPLQSLDVMTKRGAVLTAWDTATNRETAILASGVEGELAESARRTDFTPPEQ